MLGPAGGRLMLSKLDPPEAGRAVVVRPRLIDRLASAAQGQITLVTAPAGAGKTTLLRSWLAAGRVPGVPAWVSLDAADRDPATFWSYVLAALHRVGLALPSGPEIDPDGSPVHRLAAALYGRAEPVVLVLDDADVLAGSEVPEELDFLARHTGPALRLVLASRGDLQVHRLRHRLEGSVTDVHAADLAATEAEAREIFAMHGVTLSDDCVRAVLRHTAGWMAGVTLTALAAGERLGGAAQDLSDDRAIVTAADADIADYLDAEVIALLPASDVQLLLQVGLVEHVSGALAAQLSGRPAVRPALDDLGRRTSWVQRCRRHEDCHRLHPLLVRLLGTHRSAASSRRLHRRAGEWYAAGDRSVDAAVHLATARDWADAASALVNGYAVAHLSGGPRARRLLAAFAGMPPDTPGAQSAVVLAAVAVAGRDAEAAAKQLGRAEELVDDVPPGRAGALALALAVAGAGLARLSGDADRALDARAALDRAAAEIEAAGAPAGVESRAIVLADVGAALLRAGRLDAAAAVLAEDAAAVPSSFAAVRSLLAARLSLVEALRGHLSVARELAEAASAAPADPDPAGGAAARSGRGARRPGLGGRGERVRRGGRTARGAGRGCGRPGRRGRARSRPGPVAAGRRSAGRGALGAGGDQAPGRSGCAAGVAGRDAGGRGRRRLDREWPARTGAAGAGRRRARRAGRLPRDRPGAPGRRGGRPVRRGGGRPAAAGRPHAGRTGRGVAAAGGGRARVPGPEGRRAGCGPGAANRHRTAAAPAGVGSVPAAAGSAPGSGTRPGRVAPRHRCGPRPPAGRRQPGRVPTAARADARPARGRRTPDGAGSRRCSGISRRCCRPRRSPS